MHEFELISNEFSNFQKESNLQCLPGCGKCCFKPDVFCSPVELLPMALHLYQIGKAEDYLERSRLNQGFRCLFLNVANEAEFKGSCSKYEYRPLVCRTFGASARHVKNQKIEFSVCKILKEENSEDFKKLSQFQENNSERQLPFIDLCKNRLIALDPKFLDEEFPINKSLSIMLEKILFLSQFWNEK